MRERKIVIRMLILAFLLGLAVVGTGKASPALTFGCDPDVTIGIAPGDPFTIYLTAFDVTDLFLAEYSLSFDPAIISTTVADIDTGDVAPYLEFLMIESVVGGEIHIVAGRPIGVKEGLSGNVQTVKITFTVLAEGNSGLYLDDVRLKDSGGTDMTIEKIIDGFFGSSEGHYDFACDATGGLQNAFAPGDTVYVAGGGFMIKAVFLDIHAVPNVEWVDGQSIGSPVLSVTVETGWKGKAPYSLPITALGVPPGSEYDIVVDLNQDGLYDAANDGVDDVLVRPGFTVLTVPEFPFGMSVIMLLAPIIPLAYLWRLRRKVTKQ